MSIPAVLAVSIACIAASAAAAPSYRIQTTGVFTQAYANPVQVDPYVRGIGSNFIRYGTPGTPFIGDWRLIFAGATTENWTPGTVFTLGTISGYNGSVLSTTSISGLDLAITASISLCDLTCVISETGTVSEFLRLVNTINVDGDPVASADIVGFPSIGAAAAVYEGSQAFFRLTGSINSPLTLRAISYVSGDGFVAPFTDPGGDLRRVTAVPEPATWALLIIGFGMTASAVRRRRAMNPELRGSAHSGR